MVDVADILRFADEVVKRFDPQRIVLHDAADTRVGREGRRRLQQRLAAVSSA
jgi:hypothetical protein